MFTLLIQCAAEARNTKHVPGVGFLCSSCWHQKPVQFSGGTGYGQDKAGLLHCYECCTKQDREAMRDQSKPFYCYLSSDGKRVTSWPGGELGAVHSLGFSRSGWNGSEIARFHVRDVWGQWWSGRGAGRGIACTLRKMKTPKYAEKWGKQCGKCAYFIYKTEQWGDCAKTVIPIRLSGLQHHTNGTNCPAFKLRSI